MSAMNRTIRIAEVGAHLSREISVATGKTGTLQHILDLNWQHIEKLSYLDYSSRHVAEMFEKKQVDVLGRIMRDTSEVTLFNKPFSSITVSVFNSGISLEDTCQIYCSTTRPLKLFYAQKNERF